MCNYYKDFKNERFHDDNLIQIMSLIYESNQLGLVEDLLNIGNGTLGNFLNGRRKRDFDVLLEFENCNLLIETKVDSPEGQTNGQWQTERIYQNYHNRWGNKQLHFIYLTYGLSEFYIKKKDDNNYSNGSYNTSFIHITCSQVFNFIESAIDICNIDENRLIQWKNWLQFEIEKRNENTEYLLNVNSILERYKNSLNLTDYPVNRLNLFLPEFTIPYFFKLCTAWNNRNNEGIGKACLYPKGRGYAPSNDSILNFWDLWDNQEYLTCGDILDSNYLYFEFNEDFNLHLKASANIPRLENVKQFITENAQDLSNEFNGIIEDYRQGAFVLYEWDLKILSNQLEENLINIESTIQNAITILE